MALRRDPEIVKIVRDSGVLAARLESVRLVTAAEIVLGQLIEHQENLASYLRERRVDPDD